jgi:hypothetical protein
MTEHLAAYYTVALDDRRGGRRLTKRVLAAAYHRVRRVSGSTK